MPATGASPAPPPPPRSKVKRKAPKPPVQQPFADDPYGQGIPGANPYGFTSYDPDQAAPYEDAFDEQPVGGSGFAAVNAARQAVEDEAGALDEQPEEEDVAMEPPVEEAPQKPHILESEPETVIGETLQIEGTLRFERLLRLDGKFEGDLVSTGDLIVGPRGELVGDVRDMADLVVFGKVIGNINVDHLELCGAASIYGDVTCKTLLMDPTVVLVGTLNVNPFAPNLMDRHGDEVPPEGAGIAPTSRRLRLLRRSRRRRRPPHLLWRPPAARSEPEATPAVEPAAPSPVKAPAEPAPAKPRQGARPEPVPSPAKSPAKEPAPEPTEAPASPAKAAPARARRGAREGAGAGARGGRRAREIAGEARSGGAGRRRAARRGHVRRAGGGREIAREARRARGRARNRWWGRRGLGARDRDGRGGRRREPASVRGRGDSPAEAPAAAPAAR